MAIPIVSFGKEGIVDLTKEVEKDANFNPAIGHLMNTSPPLVFGNIVVIPTSLENGRVPKSKKFPKADIMAFDARTGKKVWTFHTIPRAGEFGADTWENNSNEYSGNAGAWAPFTVDEELGYLYLPVEGATGDQFGGQRPGANLFSSSLVALDIKTGKRIWHQQIIHHDIWDYDPPSSPILADITVDGRRIKAVVQLTKTAFAFVFDRTNGNPVWPIEERPVPQTRRARGAYISDAAVPHKAAGLRPAGHERRRPDRLHAAGKGAGAAGRGRLSNGTAVHASVDRRMHRRERKAR